MKHGLESHAVAAAENSATPVLQRKAGVDAIAPATIAPAIRISSRGGFRKVVRDESVAPLYLRAEQVIQVLPVSRRTLSNWQARRLIKFYKIGKTVLFKREDIQAAVEKFAVAPIGELKVRQPRSPKPFVAARNGKRRAGRITTPPMSPALTRQSEALHQ